MNFCLSMLIALCLDRLFGWPEFIFRRFSHPVVGFGHLISLFESKLNKSTWNDIPWKFEAGTPNIADSIALGVACEYLEKVGMENIWNHEMELGDYTVDRISELDKFKIKPHTNLQLGDSKIAQRVGSAVVSKYKPYAKSPVGIYNRIAKGIYA